MRRRRHPPRGGQTWRTFVRNHARELWATLIAAEESGEVERLTAWLVRQTGVRLDTLKQRYARWWPRDHAAIRATYALLDPTVSEQIDTGRGVKSRKRLDYTAKRKWTMSRKRRRNS